MFSKAVLILLLAFLLNSSSLNAQKDMGNLYAGVSLGQTKVVGSLRRNLNVRSSDKVSSLGGAGFTPGAFIGYGSLLDLANIYLGVEASYQHNNITIRKDENSFPGYVEYFTKVTKHDTLACAGKLGFTHSRHLFFVKAGIASTRFTLGFEDKTFVPAHQTGKSHRNKGLMLGLGMDYYLNPNWFLGMEYEMISYPEMDFSNNSVGSFSFKPKTYTCHLRLKYIF